MGFFYEGLNLLSFMGWIVLTASLLLLNEASRRIKWLSIFLYGLVPILLALGVFKGVLGSPSGKSWFGWVKVISALAGVWGFMLIRFTSLGQKKFASIYPVAILSINIAEAVFREFEVFATYKSLTVDSGGITIWGGPWNILNGIAGILCILTLTGFSGIRVSKDKSRDMIWPDMTWMYIIGYTLWNFAYVYNCISTRSMYAGVTILLAAIIAEYGFKRGAWLQHRAQTLSLFAMFTLSVDFQQSVYFQIYPTYNPSLLLGLSALAFLFNAGVFAYMLYTIKRHKKNPIKQEIYTHTYAYQKTLTANNL